MLNIYFGNMKGALYPAGAYFDNWVDAECILEEFSKEVIKDIDKSKVISKDVIVSDVVGTIGYKDLSGSVKSLLVMMHTNEVVDLASMGDNCLKYVSRIAMNKDLTVSTDSYRGIEFIEGLEVRILNDNSVVRNNEELFHKYLDIGEKNGW